MAQPQKRLPLFFCRGKYGKGECTLVREILVERGWKEIRPPQQPLNPDGSMEREGMPSRTKKVTIPPPKHPTPSVPKEDPPRKGKQRRPPGWQAAWTMRFSKREWHSLLPRHRINRIPGMQFLCRKDLLNGQIVAGRKRYGENEFPMWPVGFRLPDQLEELKVYAKEHPEESWIMKPPIASNGRHIRLAASLEDVLRDEEYIAKYKPLVQQYIMHPLLLEGYKITVRLYVVVTQLDPVRAYLYPNGLVRMSSRPYSTDPSTFGDTFVHLDSYEINHKRESEFVEEAKGLFSGKNEGLRLDVKYLLHHIDKEYGQGSGAQVWLSMKDALTRALLATHRSILSWAQVNVKARSNAFEVIGFDVLLDEQLRCFVIECNKTPSMSPHTDMETSIKKAMLSDAFELVDIESVRLQYARSLWTQLFDRLEKERGDQQVDSWTKGAVGEPVDLLSLSRRDVHILVDTEMEQERCGAFERLLPAPQGGPEFMAMLGVTPRTRDYLLARWIAAGQSIKDKLPQGV